MDDAATTPELAALVRGFVTDAANSDWEAVLRFYARDAKWDTSRNGVGIFRGVATIVRFWEDWRHAYEELEFTVEELLELRNGVVFVVVRQQARPVGSPGLIRQREGWIYRWVDGLIASVTIYPEAAIDEARAAAERLARERGGKLDRARYADGLMAASQSYELTYDEPIDLGGNQVLTRHEVETKGASSGAESMVVLFTVYTLREGLILKVVECLSRDDALNAAGIEE